MPMMTSQIFKHVDFTKTQKSRYLQTETLFFLQIRKFIHCTSRATSLQKIVFLTFKTYRTFIGTTYGTFMLQTQFSQARI